MKSKSTFMYTFQVTPQFTVNYIINIHINLHSVGKVVIFHVPIFVYILNMHN